MPRSMPFATHRPRLPPASLPKTDGDSRLALRVRRVLRVASAVSAQPRSELRSRREKSMQIRVGYELTYFCPQAAPMILTLSIHPSRAEDILVPDPVCTQPACAVS